MYIRFQGKRNNYSSASKLGMFQLAYELRDQSDLPSYAFAELQKNLRWLQQHLVSPDILDESEHHRAISWFKANAKDPINRMRSIKIILEENGYHIDQIFTKDPGIVIYEDKWQIVAKPRK